MQVRVAITRFPYGNQEAPSVGDWLVETVIKMKSDERVHDVIFRKFDDTPITMTRNAAVKWAKQQKADLLLMIDSDMYPDIGIKRPTEYGYAGMKPFWDVAFPFILNHNGPAVIAAPYCGPPPHENVYIFRPATYQSRHPNVDVRAEQFSREESAQRGGIEEVWMLPTGLMLIDMRAFESMKHPHFDYDYADEEKSEKATTEDCYFSRNCSLAGIRQYCAWDCWAGHWKRKLVGRPTLLTVDAVRHEYRQAILRGQSSNERLLIIGDDKYVRGTDRHARGAVEAVPVPARQARTRRHPGNNQGKRR